MNIENIRKIMNSNLGRKMLQNQYYRGHIIIDNYNKPAKQRTSGWSFVMLIFFEGKIKEETLKKYIKEGRRLSIGESLDNPSPYRFYGTMKMIQFS